MKEITLGIIGAGRIGKLHAHNIRLLPGVRIKAVSDIFADSIKEWAHSAGIPVVTVDYREILSDPDIDAVLICSSTNTHTPIIEEAAAAGKHIFCEKPVSFEIDKTIKAVESTLQAKVSLQIGFNRRFDHNFKRIRRAVAEGEIGNPHIVKITSRDPEPPSADYIKVSGGIFMDMAIHDFDLARYITGSEVEEVYVQGAVLVDPVFDELGDIDTAITTLKFQNGTLGVIDNSRKAVYGYDQRVEVFGSNGCIVVDNDHHNTAQIMTRNMVYRDTPKYFFLERYNDAYIDELRSFVECIRNGETVLVSGHDGFQAELIAHSARLSWLEKRPVRLEEVKERFGLQLTARC